MGGARALMTQCMEQAEVLTDFFVPAFTSNTVLGKAKAPETRWKVWSKEGLETDLDAI